MAQIFISYRRHDSAYLAATLSDKLQQHFGPNSVFFDVDNIPLGVDFREYIGNAVGQCDVLLVIIGEQWMGIDSQGKRRIDDPSDYVRIEIESALKRNIPVIPVLVEEATMPSPAQLPPAIESISFRNAAEIRAGRDLRQHIEQLIQGLETLFKTRPGNVRPEAQSGTQEKTASGEKTSASKGTATSRREATETRKPKPPQERTDLATPAEPRTMLDQAAKEYSELMEEIQQGLNGYTDAFLHVGNAIPTVKLANAIKAYAPSVSPGNVLLLLDNTVFGGAKDGLMLTKDTVYWRNNLSSKPISVNYRDLKSVEFGASTSIFTAAQIAINYELIDINMGDKNKLAAAVTNVLRRLMEYAKRER